MDIVFVILNYNIIKETIECVQSIKNNIDTNSYHIVIVDNGSSNNIGQKLKQKLENESNVTVIVNDENIGFAKGNNIGIKEARRIGAKYICCLNNDTLMIQKDFYNTINCKYSQKKPAIIGPEIILANGCVQHINGDLLSIEDYKMKMHSTVKYSVFDSIRSTLRSNKIGWIVIDYLKKYVTKTVYYKETTNVKLHGCCLIFTPVFFEKLDGFCKETFLYMEEEILFVDLLSNGLSNLYTPDLKILHLEDISTNTIRSNNKEKVLFVVKNEKESLKVLIKKINDNPALKNGYHK